MTVTRHTTSGARSSSKAQAQASGRGRAGVPSVTASRARGVAKRLGVGSTARSNFHAADLSRFHSQIRPCGSARVPLPLTWYAPPPRSARRIPNEMEPAWCRGVLAKSYREGRNHRR